MRVALVTFALVLAAAPAHAQPAAPAPAAPCERRDVALDGGFGRASAVSFTGAVSGDRICALVVNLAGDGFSASLGAAPADAAVVSAAVVPGAGAVLAARASGLSLVASSGGPTPAGALGVGPFVVEPGGTFPSFDGDAADVPRVVLAYAGQRVIVIRTTAGTLLDLAHALREAPALFGADAAERAVVLAGGDAAALQVRTDAGTIGTQVTTAVQLQFVKRS